MRLNRYQQAEECVRNYRLDKIGTYEPSVFLDLHPAGGLAALQGYTNSTNQAAVFDLASGHILWQPEGVPALCWLPNSGNILLIRDLYQRDPELHEGPIKIHSPLQSEFLHSVECWSWPEKRRLSGCELKVPTGWLTYIAASPRGNLAVVQWQEQDDSGIELFALTGADPHPLPKAGYRAGTHLTEYALFSPDGRYLVLACTVPDWWEPDEENDSPVSPGGNFQVGEIVVLNTQSFTYRVLPIHKELQAGWSPKDPDSASVDYMLQAADFTDLTHLCIHIMNDWTWIVNLEP
jgi:hypothetical protein